MAGDWIPMRLDLRDDPAVIFMAEKMGCREELVVGLCHTVWSWLSRNCHTGTVTNVSLVSLGRALNIGDFPQLLQECGWLKEAKTTDGKPLIVVVGWEKWLSKSAKSRLEAAQRKAAQRLMEKAQQECADDQCHEPVQDMSHKICDTTVTTEEKITEEKKRVKSEDINPPYPPSPNGKGDSVSESAAPGKTPKKPRDPKFDPLEIAAAWKDATLRETWADWCEHRKQIGSPLTERTVKAQVEKLKAMGRDRAIAAIRHTIAMGWRGIYEPDASNGKQAQPAIPPRKSRWPDPPPGNRSWSCVHPSKWHMTGEDDREMAWNAYHAEQDRIETMKILERERAEEEAEKLKQTQEVA